MPVATTAPTSVASTREDARRHTVAVLSDVIRDIGRLKRDLVKELTCDVPFAALSALAVLEQQGATRVGELADHLGIDVSVASRHASTLEERGLAERRPSDIDRRAHAIVITTEGAAMIRSARDDVRRRIDDALRDWDTADLHDLSHRLNRLREALSPTPTDP